MSKIARMVKVLPDWTGDAKVYQMTPPYDGNEYVVVSAVNNRMAHETYIFASTEDGEVSDYSELAASERNTTSHEHVLSNAGYAIGELA